ncbi:MAG TPA: TolC family protein, partial [Ignavibacteria bacterium]|nr:TolC family protein [Ignavibacteria bacterium]
MKYLRTIIFLSFFIPLFANAQITLDLNKAVQTGLEKNDKIKQYEEKSYQKEIEFNQTTSNFLPKIDLTASFNHLNDNISLDLNPIRDVMLNIQAKNQVEFTNIYTLLQGGAPLTQQQRALLFKSNYSALNSQIPQFVEQMKKQDYWSTYIQGVQPLFLGGKLIGARQYASLEKQLADAETRKVKDEVTSEIINNYLNVIMVQDIIKTRKNVLDGMIKHRDNAKKLFDDGLIAKHQYLRGEVAVADAESNLNDETNKLNLAYTALKSS